jgi:hypothetical protein
MPKIIAPATKAGHRMSKINDALRSPKYWRAAQHQRRDYHKHKIPLRFAPALTENVKAMRHHSDHG